MSRPTLVAFFSVPGFPFGGPHTSQGVEVSNRYYALGPVAIDSDGHAWCLSDDHAWNCSRPAFWKRFETEFEE